MGDEADADWDAGLIEAGREWSKEQDRKALDRLDREKKPKRTGDDRRRQDRGTRFP